ncbi:MAG: hypothetical protein K2X47_14770 [Bdellovibrionales bacterium]|nr:hypothetical protein [Bdellovibrionales bacterium]
MIHLLRTSFILWIFIGSFFPKKTFAAPDIVIRHHKTSAIDFQIYRELRTGLRTLSMEWDRKPSAEEKAFDCLELFRRLQEAKLQKRINASQKLQEEIWNLRFDDDWTPPLRSLFLEVGLGRAVQEVDPEAQRRLILEALAFATSFQEIKELPLWKDPRLQTLLQVRWNTRKLRTVSLSHFRQLGFHVLKLNGATFALDSTSEIKLPDATYRVTALSHHWSPWTKRMATTQITSAEPELISLLQGDCLNPQLSGVMKEMHRTVHAVFDRICTRIWAEDRWLPLKENVSPITNPTLNLSELPKEDASSADSTLKKYGPPMLVVGLLAGLVITFVKSQSVNSPSNSVSEGTPPPPPTGEVVQIPSRY